MHSHSGKIRADQPSIHSRIMTMSNITRFHMPIPSGEQLRAARINAGLSQVQAAELMGYALQVGSRGGGQSRTWQALESPTDDRKMQGSVFSMFLLLTGQHPELRLVERTSSETDPA